jgi:putative heme-binding domain-containing protein
MPFSSFRLQLNLFYSDSVSWPTVSWHDLSLIALGLLWSLAGTGPRSEVRADEVSQQVPVLVAEADQLLMLPAADQDLIRLVQIELALSDESGEPSHAACRRILRALAMSENVTAMDHVHSIFENEPERRGVVAWALSESTSVRPDDLQDWRYMVRSLNVIKGDDAVAVMKALQRFRPRANKAHWVRQVILVGLKLNVDQQAAATSLLKHWTGVPNGKTRWTLAEYQEWFAKEHADQPAAEWPVDATNRKWNLATLERQVASFHTTPDLVEAGRAAYEKAGCQKCHRRGKLGEPFGPDLTSLGWRRQKSEILQAILFPSHELNEEYPSVTIELKDGRTLSGILSSGSQDKMSIVSAQSVRVEFDRADIVQIVNQKISNMPEGTLEPLTLDEIRALFAFLTSIDGVPRPHGDELE